MTATPEGATLAIDGTPTQLGNFTIEVTVTDNAKPQDASTYRLTFEVAETQAQPQGTLKLDDPLSLTDELGQTVDIGTTASGGIEPYTGAVTAGSLPPGLLLNRSAGTITGTPTERGGFNFTIVATNVATGATKQGGTYNFTVSPAGT